jgi:CheY-like chemotaxis protein
MKKILFIEDEELLNKAYQKQFCDLYSCFFATTGSEGLKLAQTEKPDLIILDIILPGGQNGFDVLRQLKQNQLTKDIGVIVLTNLSDENKSAKSYGVLECLVKADTDLEQIKTTINKYLGQQQ